MSSLICQTLFIIMKNKPVAVSVGIMAYNEEKNIANILDALLAQKLKSVFIEEIVVVSSACTDKTDEIVEEYAKKESRIKLIKQQHRNGKVRAINEYLARTKSPIIVMESADTIPDSDAIENICKPMVENEKIGIVGARPVPTNENHTFMGFATHMQWELHHRASTIKPKCGEMLAMRNEMDEIPPELIIDDAYIELFFEKIGKGIAYAKDSIVLNKGPESIKDFIKRRKNLAAGFLQLKEKFNYSPSTNRKRWLIKETILITKGNPKKLLWSFFAFSLNSYAGFLGMIDYKVKKKANPVWEIATSTKSLKPKTRSKNA